MQEGHNSQSEYEGATHWLWMGYKSGSIVIRGIARGATGGICPPPFFPERRCNTLYLPPPFFPRKTRQSVIMIFSNSYCNVSSESSLVVLRPEKDDRNAVYKAISFQTSQRAIVLFRRESEGQVNYFRFKKALCAQFFSTLPHLF